MSQSTVAWAAPPVIPAQAGIQFICTESANAGSHTRFQILVSILSQDSLDSRLRGNDENGNLRHERFE
ncbi:MAG: hypothetical protein JWP89_2442 [Schlesneria sp.]|nr:hypothetical protein [Schlesneria sp.]